MKLTYQLSILLITVMLLVTGCLRVKEDESGGWEHPLTKKGRLHSPLVEVDPFVFNDEFYLLENWRSGWDWPNQPGHTSVINHEMWIAHLPNGPEDYNGRRYISAALTENTLGTAIVWENRVYVFGVNAANGNQYVDMTWSDDLKRWSAPLKVLDSHVGDIFNVSLTRDDKGFVFLWETNGVGTPFTMCFGRLDSLTDNWNDHIIVNAHYGKQKYTGGPAVFYEDGWYYLLYLEALNTGWETRITRSLDLINWKDASEDRPFITFNTDHKNVPLLAPEVKEINASDPGLTYYDGQVIVYFTGSNQKVAGDLQWATFNGTIQELMESFFVKTEIPLTKLQTSIGMPSIKF